MRPLTQGTLFLLLNCFLLVYPQEKYTISGTVSEAASNETLIGVTVLVPELNTGVTTNEYGFYSITLPEGDYTLQIGYLGFREVSQSLSLSQNLKLNIKMEELAEELEEVIVTEDIEKMDIRKPQMSVNSLSAETIKKIPVILGEADVIKSILLLPGVTNAGEGGVRFQCTRRCGRSEFDFTGRGHHFQFLPPVRFFLRFQSRCH